MGVIRSTTHFPQQLILTTADLRLGQCLCANDQIHGATFDLTLSLRSAAAMDREHSHLIDPAHVVLEFNEFVYVLGEYRSNKR